MQCTGLNASEFTAMNQNMITRERFLAAFALYHASMRTILHYGIMTEALHSVALEATVFYDARASYLGACVLFGALV